MAFKNGNNKPRNRSTNNRSLSNRISTLQREMNPVIHVSGINLSSSKKQYVTRKFSVYVNTGSNASVNLYPVTLDVPDGSKILTLKIKGINTRSISADFSGSNLMAVNNSSTSIPFSTGLKKSISAPLSRFPVIKANIPDVLSNPLDGDSTTTLLATVAALDITTNALFQIDFTAKYLV